MTELALNSESRDIRGNRKFAESRQENRTGVSRAPIYIRNQDRGFFCGSDVIFCGLLRIRAAWNHGVDVWTGIYRRTAVESVRCRRSSREFLGDRWGNCAADVSVAEKWDGLAWRDLPRLQDARD